MPNPGLSPDEMLEALRLVSEYGSITEAARRIGMNRETLQGRVDRARKKIAAGELLADIETRVPDGFTAKGVSTLYDAEGNVRAQWVKVNADQDKAREAFEVAIRDLCASVPARMRCVVPSSFCSASSASRISGSRAAGGRLSSAGFTSQA